jgi:hypothetical protein
LAVVSEVSSLSFASTFALGLLSSGFFLANDLAHP